MFNLSTLKLSLSSMTNLQSLIDQHNVKTLTDGKKPSRLSNCRCMDSCLLTSKWLAKCIVYKAELTTTNKRKLYIAITNEEFKTRFNNHTRSFRHKRYSTDTELLKHIWKLSNDKIQYDMKWNIAAYASPYKCGSRRYDLCLTENLKIVREDLALLLNKRNK